MVTASVAFGPAFGVGPPLSVGNLVLAAVDAMIRAVGKNTHLGSILLLAPLACTPPTEPLRIERTLERLTELDAQLVYQAIRLANPSGLGRVARHDVHGRPPRRLQAAMEMTAEYDSVARQYVTDFEDVRNSVIPWLQSGMARGWTLLDTIVYVQMQLMATFPDGLIFRKCGLPLALESQQRAQAVLDSGLPLEPGYERSLREFDVWLRTDGHRRNPGTTADLIAAGLFGGLRTGQLVLTTETSTWAQTVKGSVP